MFVRYEITPASPWASLLSQDNGVFLTADLSIAASARIVLVMIQGSGRGKSRPVAWP
jgi:hypothetical protein